TSFKLLYAPYELALFHLNPYPLSITTPTGRNSCRTSTVPACASSTSCNCRYTKGLSSVPPPRSSTPKSRTALCIWLGCIAPPVRFPLRLFHAACVRLIVLPAPCMLLYIALRLFSESTPCIITVLYPILLPTKPFCPGAAGVAPLRTTIYCLPL